MLDDAKSQLVSQARLCSPTQSQFLLEGEVHYPGLSRDAIVALLRLNPQAACIDMLPRLLERSSADPLVPIALQACAAVLEEDSDFPGRPDESTIGAAALPAIRRLLYGIAAGQLGAASTPQRGGLPLPKSDALLLSSMIRLLDAAPRIFHLDVRNRAPTLHTGSSAPQRFDSMHIDVDLGAFDPDSVSASYRTLRWLCLSGGDATTTRLLATLMSSLQASAIRDLLSAPPHHRDNSEALLLETACLVYPTLAACVLQEDDTEIGLEALRKFCDWLSNMATAMQHCPSVRRQGLTGLLGLVETVAILALVKFSEDLTEDLAELCRQATSIASLTSHPAGNISSLLQALAQTNGPVRGGRQAQFKRLLQIFSSVEEPSPSIDFAWDEAIRMWRTAFDDAAKPTDTGRRQTDDEDETKRLRLLALTTAIAHLVRKEDHAAGLIELHTCLPSRFHAVDRSSRGTTISVYLRNLLDLLLSGSPTVRDAARVALAQHVHPYLLPDILPLTRIVMNESAILTTIHAGHSGTTSSLMGYDQILSILLGIASRIPVGDELDDTASSHFCEIAYIASALARIHSNDSDGLRLMSKASKMVLQSMDIGKSRLSADYLGKILPVLLDFAVFAAEVGLCGHVLQLLISLLDRH